MYFFIVFVNKYISLYGLRTFSIIIFKIILVNSNQNMRFYRKYTLYTNARYRYGYYNNQIF